MDIWKKNIVILGIFTMLIILSMSSSAETDSTGDVWHWSQTETTWSWEEYTGSKPNIDITSISYSITDSQATLTMVVNGSIVNSEKIFYYMQLVSTEGTYQAIYRNGIGTVTGTDDYSGFYTLIDNPVSGNTFTATFTISNPSATFDIWAYAAEYTTFTDTLTSEWWGDWAPAKYAPWYTGEQNGEKEPDGEETNGEETNGEETDGEETDGKKEKKTPGFELITFLIAFAMAIILLRRKK